MKDSKYPQIDAKHFHYHNDGTGRDQYVKHINGGLYSKKMIIGLELSPKITYERMQFPKTTTNKRSKMLLPSPHQKIQHYYGDGKGRDYFVTLDDGGIVQLQSWKDHPDQAFPAALRKYRKEYSSPDSVKYLLPNNQKLKSMSNLLSMKQSEMSRQLSSPKIEIRPQRQSFIPDLVEGGKYQTYQQLKYQSKATSFV